MKTKYHALLILIFISISACLTETFPSNAQEKTSLNKISTDTPTQEELTVKHNSIADRFSPPAGYERVPLSALSFENYLRYLPLKPVGALVQYYNGQFKENRNIYEAVVDLKIGTRDLHQCADAIMRLRGEYLWEQKQYDKIHFNFTNGFRVDYTEWMKGRRIVVKGNDTYWNNRHQPSNEYQDFWAYMEMIFAYAGTASLEKELHPISIANMEVGHIFIQGGFPGHAVIVLDMAVDPKTGEKVFMLGQSYMPAQELQVLYNPNKPEQSPWYQLIDRPIRTPEWTFSPNDLKCFKD